MPSTTWVLQHIHRKGLRIPISKREIKIGRSRQLDFESTNVNVSRNHAVFVLSNEKLYVKDNKSANGTYVNGTKIQPERLIEIFENDEVGLGFYSQLEIQFPQFTDNRDSDNRSANLIFKVTRTRTASNLEADKQTTLLEQCDKNLTNNNQSVKSDADNHNIAFVQKKPPIESVEHLLQILADSQFQSEESVVAVRPEKRENVTDDNRIVNANKENNMEKVPVNHNTDSLNRITTSVVCNGVVSIISLSNESDNVLLSKFKSKEDADILQDIKKDQSGDIQIKKENGNKDIKIEASEMIGKVKEEVIVISDDEDYSELMDGDCTNANGNDEGLINENMYSTIKKELEAFDEVPFGTVIHNVCIDDNDESMSFTSWFEDNEDNEDRNRVESTSSKTNQAQLNGDMCENHTAERVTNVLQSTDQAQRVDTIDANCDPTTFGGLLEGQCDQFSTAPSLNRNSIKTSKGNEKENSEQQVNTTSLNENCDAMSFSSWLDDHNNKTEGKADKVSNVKVNGNLNKVPVIKETEKKKRNSKPIKTSTFYKGQHLQASRAVKGDIRDIRKKRLKEIALKPSVEAKSINDETKVSAAKKVKVSESRGNFLMENRDSAPSTSKKDLVQPPKEINKLIKPLTLKRKVPIIEPHTEKNRAKKQCGSKDEEIPSSSTRSKSLKHLNSNYIAVSHRNDDIEEIIGEMLLWNPFWLVECRQMKTVPRAIHNGQLQKMPKRFSSYDEYYNIVTPPMMIELWSFLAKEYEQQKHKFLAELIDVRTDPTQTILYYFTYIDKKQYYNANLHVRESDILILNYECEVQNKKKPKYVLGLVQKTAKSFLQPNHYIKKNFVDSLKIVPYARFNFHVLITSYEGTIAKGVNSLRPIGSIVSPMRMFKSVKALRNSKLLPYVLHPRTELYKIELPLDHQQLYCKTNLNVSQKKAVLEASYICQRSDPGIYLIQGPPGTGKTTVILNILKQILYNPTYSNRKCLLILAPSNAAVDEMVFRILGLKKTMKEDGRELKLLRYGPKNMIHPDVVKYSLTEIAKTNLQKDLFASLSPSDQQELKSQKQQICDLRALSFSSDPSCKEELATALWKYDKMCQKILGQRYYSSLQKCEERCLIGAEVICTTLSSCIRFQMEDTFRRNPDRISCCIVDEATQSNEQEALTPLKLGVRKLILVGDPKQLPAVTQAKEVKNYGYGDSLFTRIMSNFPNDKTSPVQLLDVQYRMHPEISQFPNKVFYSGRLKDSEHLSTRPSIFKNLRPYLVFNFDMESIVNSQEYVNKPETFCVIKLLNVITKHYTNTYTVGVVTPYNNQKTEINNHLKMIKYRPSITVNTVDSFQGQEKDIIIMSCVREITNNFLSDAQRLNVAMTRARHALYIIASANLFMTSNIFGIIRSDAQRRNLLVDVFPHTTEKQLLKHLLNTTEP